jgi:hypothetical protein
MTVKLGTSGPLPREARGQQVTIRATIGYSSMRYVDVIVGGTAMPVPIDHLRASIVPDTSALAGRAIALCRKLAAWPQSPGDATGLRDACDVARSIIEELDA